jgi:delta-aminolevulinic acid dehydratase/porphobilinogen synthase
MPRKKTTETELEIKENSKANEVSADDKAAKIAKLKEKFSLPICAYQVSGEYAMIRAGEEKGMLDANKVFYESLISIKSAGADFIFTYAAPFILDML